jgi:hypothetical protein
MEILGKLFGSTARVKIIRLFLLNQEEGFEVSTIASRAKVTTTVTRSELRLLESIGFIKSKTIFKETLRKKKKVSGWFFDAQFSFTKELESLVIGTGLFSGKELAASFKKAGKIKLLIASGVFLKNNQSPIDLLIVGDSLNKKLLEKNIKDIEAEIGRELVYGIFSVQEFMYRMEMYDKLVWDVIEFEHEKVIATDGFIELLAR